MLCSVVISLTTEVMWGLEHDQEGWGEGEEFGNGGGTLSSPILSVHWVAAEVCERRGESEARGAPRRGTAVGREQMSNADFCLGSMTEPRSEVLHCWPD